MKIEELMERAGINQTGRAIAYVKDALEEINTITEANIDTERVDIEKDKRFYDLPKNYVKITDIRVKNHLNSKDEYRSIPRMVYEPINKDGDGI
tara:strand:- start:2622 stop:2903 length:282 start_codon:yes stop_codon:yes gene_type:complete